MTSYEDRFAWVADEFTATVAAVPSDAWDCDAPCDGWVARDVVGHLTSWVPSFLRATADVDITDGPSTNEDPAGAWLHLRGSLASILADPATADTVVDSPLGRLSVADLIDRIVTTDVFLHRWDLARAVGLECHLDQSEAQRLLDGMLPMDAQLRTSGHYGPRVEVPEDADVQTALLAFIGRDPAV